MGDKSAPLLRFRFTVKAGFAGGEPRPNRVCHHMAAAAVQQWEDRFRDLARSHGWSYEIEVHPDGGIPRAVRHFDDFQQVLSLFVGGPNGNAITAGLVIPALDQTRQELFGGSYDPRTDHPRCYEVFRKPLPGGDELPDASTLDPTFMDFSRMISLLRRPGSIGPLLEQRRDGVRWSWIALNRLAWGEEEALRQIDAELAQLRRWSVGNLVEAAVLKLLRSKARQRDFERLEEAKGRLGMITAGVDAQRFQLPTLTMAAEDNPSEGPGRDGNPDEDTETPVGDSETPVGDSDTIAAHKCSSHHRKQVEESERCGCFHCLATFPPATIDEWVDKDDTGVGQTAMCPVCDIDSVIGSAAGFPLTREFLARMQRHWFGE
jgi:hypothetical protein